MTVGPMELVIVLMIVLFVFGAGRLADVGGGIGRSIREFRVASAPRKAQPSSTQAQDQTN